MVRKTFARAYKVEEVALPPAARGRVHALTFTSKKFPLDKRAHFNLANVYFTSGQGDMKGKQNQIETLLLLDRSSRSVIGGDFNFVEQAADCTGPLENCCLTGEAKGAWEDVKKHLRISDVVQSGHTRFQKGRGGHSSARLDRFYTSTSTAELALLTELAYPVAANGFWCRDQTVLQARLASGASVPLIARGWDHLPLALDISTKPTGASKQADIPAWAAKVPGFAEAVVLEFGEQDDSANPFDELDRWKAAVRSTYKKLVKGKKELADKYGGQVDKLTRAIGLLRLCAAANPDQDQIGAVMRNHPYLEGLARPRAADQLEGGCYLTEDLEEFIDGLYGDGLREIADAQRSGGQDQYRPAAHLPGSKIEDNLLSELKTQLPCDRSRLTALRDTTTEAATDDPKDLDRKVGGYYGQIWARETEGAEAGEIKRYLDQYTKRIPAGAVPGVPDREDVEDVVQKTNNSCAGPDGTPFACYRADGIAGGPVSAILQRMLAFLCNGGIPPASFNKARLFLIAKTDSLLVQDTRPISVTDAANRIIASCLAEALTPALQDFLEGTQKGFCPGRVGTEHVHELTRTFYASLSKKKQMYLLSLDTARAFDSISHHYIRALLRHIGMPSWVCFLVRGLLHNVTVVAMIAGANATPIAIHRGVKQGCPFSPLLFIICFDVLLWHLAREGALAAYAYADDLALTTTCARKLLRALSIIKAFSRVSGLGLNAKKTVIVTTLGLHPEVRLELDNAGWKAIKASPKCVYLGVAVGPRISTREVFAGAAAKFFKRLAAYRPFLARSSMHTRILVANVFLLPLLYYLCQFYIAPFHTVVIPVRLALHRMVVAFRGTAFAYAHLLTQRAEGGPFVPLRDLWATNVSMLAATHNLEESDGNDIPAMGEQGHEYWPLTQWKGHAMDNCMAPDGHAAYCAFVILEDHAARRHGRSIDLSGLPGRGKKDAAKRRRFLYRLLATGGFRAARSDPRKPTSLDRKIGRYVEGDRPGRHFAAQAKGVAGRLTPAVWNNQLRLMFNALPFDHRRADAHMEVTPRPNGLWESDFPCYFCGHGEDSTEHVYGECLVVRAARKRVARMLGCVLTDDMAVTLLAFPVVKNPAVAVGIICFNWAVWAERSEYLPTLGHTPSFESTVNRIHLRAQRRVPADKQNCGGRQEQSVADFARSPPLDAAVAFTDGSAIPNPGPCGAGYILRLAGQEDYATTSTPMGYGDNNKGEMGAIHGALTAVAAGLRDGTVQKRSLFLCFSDSALCIAFLDRGWAFPSWKDLAHGTRALLREVRAQMTVVFYWIRGHAGIPGNEEADVAAKAAARKAMADLRPP